MRTITASK